MREMFAVLEQQRVSKDANELGPPSEKRREAMMQKLQAESNEQLNSGEIKRPVKTKTPREVFMEAQANATNNK